jgi:hypothetical protein
MTETELLDFLYRHGKNVSRLSHPAESAFHEPTVTVRATIADIPIDFRCRHGLALALNGRFVHDDRILEDIADHLNRTPPHGKLMVVRNVQGRKVELWTEWVYKATGEKVAYKVEFHLKTRLNNGEKPKTEYLTKYTRGDLQAIATAVMNGENTCGLIDYLLETAPNFQALWERAVPTSKPEVRG